ncbi:MAG: SOS response-associated peptidase, partial [Anaerolineales bacterium]
PEGSELRSATIITTEPNPLVGKVHARMPVILKPEDYSIWLAKEDKRPEELQHLLTAYPAEEMVAYPVSTAVNSPGNESPGNIQPLE